MSVGDWTIHKGRIKLRVLYHIHDADRKHVCVRSCIKSKDQRWFCPICNESAPQEIQFVADLCNCEGFDYP